jgi:hypothetical protein
MPTTLNERQPASTLALTFFDPQLEPPNEAAIFEGLMFASDLVAWIGREKHRKTNILLQLAISASLGRNFLTFHFAAPRPLRVVFVDYESKTGALKNRYESISRAMSLSPVDQELLRQNLRIIEVRQMRQDAKFFPRFPLNDSDAKETQFWKELIAGNPADLYIIDPMRCFHAADENDSKIEKLMERMRTFFRSSTVIISHHMRKQFNNAKKNDEYHNGSLRAGMREWSDGARGSGAIKAHADVIVCQERVIEGETELVYLGAFLKDGADIEPIPLVETDNESFLFKPSTDIPSHLRSSYDALKGRQNFRDKSAAAQVLQAKVGNGRSTAFRHVNQLAERGLLVEGEDGWKVTG